VLYGFEGLVCKASTSKNMTPTGLKLALIALLLCAPLGRILWAMFLDPKKFDRLPLAGRVATMAVFAAAWLLFLLCISAASVANRP
jgi:hypothetical protein